MTHKTLKEAYESVGLRMQVGDTISEQTPISYVDGIYYSYGTVGSSAVESLTNVDLILWRR